MPYNRPDLGQIVHEIEEDIASRVPGGETRLRRSTLGVLARVMGGVGHGLYGFINWVSLQLFPSCSDEDSLKLHGDIRKIYRKAAVQAEGPGLFRGVPGSVLPAGTAVKRADGAEYESLEDARADASGLAAVPLRALAAGGDGNVPAGTGLQLVSPLRAFSGQGEAGVGGLTGGLDLESVESWRGRIVYRWQNPERGGSAADWVRWATEVPGVAKAVCLPHWVGLGSIGMIIVADPASGSLIPDAVTVARCQAWLSDPARRPPGATEVYVIAPAPLPVNPVIKGLNPDTEAVRAAVAAELADLFAREAEPGKEMPRSHIAEAVSAATGEYDHELLAPAFNVAVRPYELPVLGEISFMAAG